MVSYLEFRDKLHEMGCFSVSQIRLMFPTLDRSSLTRWIGKGLLIRVRKEWYAFPDMLKETDFARYIACKIYKPSYISLHTALSIYGMIPEAVSQITSVTTLKTATFENDFAQYDYKNVKQELFFGFKPVLLPNRNGEAWYLALPEKALLDLLYLYPFYNTEEELMQLRLDEDFMNDDIDLERLTEYQNRIGSKALDGRVRKLLKLYDL